MKKKTKKRLIIGLIIAVGSSILIYLLRGVFAFIFFFMSMDSSSKDDLVENYELKKTAIHELKTSFDSIVPDGFKIYIEFKDKKNIDLWVYEKSDSIDKKMICLFQQWDINPYDYVMEPMTKYDSSEYAPKTKDLGLVKEKLNWTENTFIEIKKILDNANCISIENGEPAEIGFARSGMGKYFYYIFQDPIPGNEIENWNDSCSYIYYDSKMVLGYAGGAIGAQCFPDPD
nr:hypothetical protein [uncultured Marinifilum sp.]